MLETLLLLACLSGTEKSCITSGEQYTKYSGIDKTIEKIGKENPLLAHMVGVIGLARERKVYFQVNGPIFYTAQLNGSDLINMALYKREF